MSLRVKRTLTAFAIAVAVTCLLILFWQSRHASISVWAPWVCLYAVPGFGNVGYQWWLYGDSAKAVAKRRPIEQRRAARVGRHM